MAAILPLMKNVILILMMCVAPILMQAASADSEFNIKNHQGKVVYVDFWASWCTPCRASFPFMKQLVEQHGDELVIAAINVDSDREAADTFLQAFDVNFDIHYDPEGKLAESFDVKGMPTSYLFNRSGQLIGTHIGFRNKDIDKLSTAIADAIENQE